MTYLNRAAAAACAGALALVSVPAHAHVVAGARVFPVTLTCDDPGVSGLVAEHAGHDMDRGAGRHLHGGLG